ncbi:MAG TPA: hypothetical protein VFK70_17050, partial [Vicinamibacteria bacterium]|nr:hypothetical protein [Vicinamibacteria bacterium]
VTAVSLPVAVHQARQPPVEYQALRHVARQPAPGVVLVSRPDDLLAVYAPLFEERVRLVRVPDDRVGTVRERAVALGHDLYVTAVPPTDSAGWVPVGHFCRDPMIEPLIASELWLFRAGPPDADAPLPACGEER